MTITQTLNHPPLTAAEQAELRALYETGWTLGAIADALGCHYQTVSRYVRRLALPRRGGPRDYAPLLPVLRDLDAAHETIPAMAAALRLSPATVIRLRAELGLPTRKRGRRPTRTTPHPRARPPAVR